jgi:hypothetical protein
MADTGAFFGNPNLQRQGARARALAAQRDVNTLADPLTYAAVQGLLGTRPDEMGFSVLNPDYEKIKKVAEPAFALGLLGQAAPLLAPLTKGLPVGASIKNVGDDLLSYRGSHTAPDRDFGAPLHDLTGGGQMYPADVYSSKAAQIYGGGVPYDQKAFSIAQQYKDKPDALVTIYRAVPKDISNSEKLATLEKQMAAYMKRGTLPKDAENYSSGSKWYDAAYERREALRKMPDEPSNQVNKINAGDWVTLTREYAKDHGESALNGEYKIISQKVKAKDVFTNADSIHEFGYQPQKPSPTAPRQEALDTAQRNAALPVEKGGLGLPKDNTPEMRAEASGLLDAYHGSKQDITGLFKAGYDDNLAFVTQDPEFASKWIGKGKLNQRIGAEDEMKAAEEIYRQNKYKNTDNALLEKLQGEEFNAAYDKMAAAARAENEKEFGTRGNATGLFDTVYPVKVQANKTFNPETDMDVMKEFFDANDIPQKLQDLYAGGNYMMYETKPVVNYLKSKGYDSMRLRESTGDNYPTIALFNPDTVRSRFAAFDPFRRDTETALAKGVAPPDILAGVLPLGLLADEEQRKKLYELMPSLLGE